MLILFNKMALKQGNKTLDSSTEDKIKAAAKTVFHKKGYSATRTRDIAEEANINLALLNYYFRSKENLFQVIMLETMQTFFKSLTDVFNDTNTSFEEKVELLAERYIDVLLANPEIPVFILNELRNQPEELLSKIGVKEILMKSEFLKQFQQNIIEKKIKQINPMHFIMNIMGMIVFPFIAKPMLKGLGDIGDEQFLLLMQERKSLIPRWIIGALKNN